MAQENKKKEWCWRKKFLCIITEKCVVEEENVYFITTERAYKNNVKVRKMLCIINLLLSNDVKKFSALFVVSCLAYE